MGRGGALDTSFLPGPQKVPPHLAEQAWKHCIDREEMCAMARGPGDRPKAEMLKRNPITWETPDCSRAGTGYSSSYGGANILTLEDLPTRLGTAQSMRSSMSGMSRGAFSRGSQRLGTSRRLGSAGSLASVPASHLSSILSEQLEEERQHRQSAEREVAELKAKLAQSGQAKPAAQD